MAFPKIEMHGSSRPNISCGATVPAATLRLYESLRRKRVWNVSRPSATAHRCGLAIPSKPTRARRRPTPKTPGPLRNSEPRSQAGSAPSATATARGSGTSSGASQNSRSAPTAYPAAARGPASSSSSGSTARSGRSRPLGGGAGGAGGPCRRRCGLPALPAAGGPRRRPCGLPAFPAALPVRRSLRGRPWRGPGPWGGGMGMAGRRGCRRGRLAFLRPAFLWPTGWLGRLPKLEKRSIKASGGRPSACAKASGRWFFSAGRPPPSQRASIAPSFGLGWLGPPEQDLGSPSACVIRFPVRNSRPPLGVLPWWAAAGAAAAALPAPRPCPRRFLQSQTPPESSAQRAATRSAPTGGTGSWRTTSRAGSSGNP